MKQQESRARRNWQKLKNIIRSGTLASKGKQRRFNLFDRHIQHFPSHLLTKLTADNVTLLQKSPLPIYKELLHFEGEIDTTGRWVWQAQEVAAYFFLQKGEAIIAEVLLGQFHNNGQLRILEIGAGSSGLAGLALWQVASRMKGVQARIELTDGQAQNIPFLQDNLTLNTGVSVGCLARRLLWGQEDVVRNISKPEQQRQSFEVIIVCDCLYFQNFHKQLLLTIDSYLVRGGSALFINPSRGNSMPAFFSLAKERNFLREQIIFDDAKYQMQFQKAREASGFEEDKHAILFSKLYRK